MATDLQAQLITAFQQIWSNLASAIRGHQLTDDSNPVPLLSSIASTTDTPEKKKFCSLLGCYDVKFGEMKAQLESYNSRNSKSASELVQVQGEATELNKAISLAQQEILHLSQSSSQKSAARSPFSGHNDNDKIAKLNDKVSTLQAEYNRLPATHNTSSTKNSEVNDGSASKARRTRSDPEEFSGTKKDTEKRQMVYESWKAQIQQIFLVDGNCFPSSFHIISYITSQPSGKAWLAVQDGTAKNALDTLFQGKSAYGDFIADFDHLAEMAKYDDRTKVNLPASNNYTGWSDMINTIARNLQQQEHIAKLQAPTSTIQQNNPNEPNQNFEHDDPMDLSRIRLSTAEKNYRMENGLCVACGNSGHIAKDHHRKIDPIPMPRRSKNLIASRGNDNDNRPSPKQNFSPNQKIIPPNNSQPLPTPNLHYSPM
ncbi:hypothetical protein EV44_g1315 [Erysiphe necator]|uniref:Uncharacterized protein n=1 Tax=Uncinula necator TaxID=52586 RepID=A0A0B1NX95_UNCNE|nr:hypothetical protein EV44_g1315 [Erysiphe necator]